MAGSLGVPGPRVYFLAFVLSAALAGVAGALLAPVVSVYTTVGSDVIINAFIVVVAGGMGNFRGAAMVALLLGEVEAGGPVLFPPGERPSLSPAPGVPHPGVSLRGQTAAGCRPP